LPNIRKIRNQPSLYFDLAIHIINLSYKKTRRRLKMPAIRLLLSGEKEDYNVASIIKALTEITCEILEKDKDRTMIIVDFIQRDLWFIGSNSLESLEKNSFKIDITVTDETCTKDQKASYIKEAHNLLNQYVSQLHEHSNIHIIDCRGGAYGYGGITQDYLYYNK